MTESQLWVKRRIDQIITTLEKVAAKIDPVYYPNHNSYMIDIFDETLSKLYNESATEFESDSFTDKYSGIIVTLQDLFGSDLEEYYNSVMKKEPINESFDRILDLYQKVNKGEELKPSEQTMMRSFKKFVDNGGDAEEFVYDESEQYDIDEREGMRFRWKRYGSPLTFEFSNEEQKDGEIEYYGEVTYMGDEFLGVIVTDKRGFIIEYDFYSVLSNEDVRLQDVLKEAGIEAEIINFFAEDVIPKLRR